MTGGSLEESKEALAIAETDGLLCNWILLPRICFLVMFLNVGFYLFETFLSVAGRLFCTVGVHPTRCKVSDCFLKCFLYDYFDVTLLCV